MITVKNVTTDEPVVGASVMADGVLLSGMTDSNGQISGDGSTIQIAGYFSAEYTETGDKDIWCEMATTSIGGGPGGGGLIDPGNPVPDPTHH